MFCWIELATSDQAAAKSFYTSLFGWTAEDSPMGPGQLYTSFRHSGKDIGGGYTLMPDQVAMHVPPNWLLYVSVENADAAMAKAKELGSNVLAGPMDVMDYGRMVVLQDPTGAVFAVWQPKQHQGMGIVGDEGTFSWADLVTTDAAKASAFYSGLFGWQLLKSEHDPENDYLHIKNGEHYIGGIPPATHRPANVPPHWLIYFHASDCDAAANKAKEMGAHLYLQPLTIENVGRMAVVADPQGAVFALFQPMRKDAPKVNKLVSE
jgi:hypothetical protein